MPFLSELVSRRGKHARDIGSTYCQSVEDTYDEMAGVTH